MRILVAILCILCCSQAALANTTYVCTHGSMERKIEVVSLGTTTVPCEVRYTKLGDTQVLWSAQAEEGYCEARAAEFVEKQRGWGWECVESGAEPTDAPAEDLSEGQLPE